MSQFLQQQCEYCLALLGCQGVGKSSIMTRFSQDTFNPKYAPTCGKLLINTMGDV